MITLNVSMMAAAHTIGGAAGIGVRGTLAMSGENYISDNQQIGTSAEAITVGDVTGAGALVYLENADNTNKVKISADAAAGSNVANLLPGQFCVFFSGPGTPALYAKADTAEITLVKRVFESVAPAQLVQFRPVLPELGSLLTRFSLTATIDGHPITINKSKTDTSVKMVGLLTRPVNETSPDTYVFPYTTMTGATLYGTACGINLDTTNPSTLQDFDVFPTGDLQEFGAVPANLGFYILPLNLNRQIFNMADPDVAGASFVTRPYPTV